MSEAFPRVSRPEGNDQQRQVSMTKVPTVTRGTFTFTSSQRRKMSTPSSSRNALNGNIKGLKKTPNEGIPEHEATACTWSADLSITAEDDDEEDDG